MPKHIQVLRQGGNAKEIVTIKGLLEKGNSVEEVAAWMGISPKFIQQYAPKPKPKPKPKAKAKKKATNTKIIKETIEAESNVTGSDM